MLFSELVESFPIQPPRDSDVEPPLKGVVVVDFTHFVAGPLATMMFADYGADVIKIESPGKGDDFRYYPPHDARIKNEGAPYLWANRNKRSVALDLKTPEGLEVARELIGKADVLMENFSTGVMARFGFDYESCRRINPRLIYVSISAYGREGEFADRSGFDPIVQAESGFMSMNGYPDREGVRAASAVMDMSAAMMASNATLLALRARERSNLGQYVDVVLFDTALLMTGFAAMQYLFGAKEPRRTANTAPDTCPSGLFHCKDRAFLLNSGNSRIFERLLRDVLDRPDMASDPDLLDRNKRLERREEINQILHDAFMAQPWSYWKPRLRAALVPHGEVRTLAEALTSEEARQRQRVTRIPHPDVGWIPNMPLPFRLADTPPVDPTPAPSIGQHTAQVLHDVLGLSAERVQALAQRGAFGPPPQGAGGDLAAANRA
jgi:crotonobetainyl-CoA:carnitine CoA-transferase CaiB-like acyl-CoA transferase